MFQVMLSLLMGGLGCSGVAKAGQYPTNLAIGTGGALTSPGNTFPGATRPFGWVRLSPDTGIVAGSSVFVPSNNYGSAGYSDQHNAVSGFSHTRLSGTGVREGGALRVRPEVVFADRTDSVLELDHINESFEPGFYSVTFPKTGLKAELTASLRCGVHRYSVLDSGGSQLVLNLDPRSSLYSIPTLVTDSKVHGEKFSISMRQQGDFSERYGGYTLYAYGEFNIGPQTHVAAAQDVLRFKFRHGQRQVELRVCFSPVGIDNAKLNFAAEVQGKSFDQIKAVAISDWDQMLGRAKIQVKNQDFARSYYTALYHSLLMPTNFSDVNGQYLGFDQQVHSASRFTYRTDMSLWDSFRTVHPLYTLIAPQVQCDSLHSLLAMADQSGMLPRWPSGSGESGSMFGSPANFLFSESLAKKTCEFDTAKALHYMVKSASHEPPTRSSRDFACWTVGYCPADRVDQSVSKTLEFAWADAMTARMAQQLGHSQVAREFTERGRAYLKIWDPAQRYFAPLNSVGQFQKIEPDLLPYIDFWKKAQAFAEGSANQWRYSVPHEPQELIKLFGGAEAFTSELEAFMRKHSPSRSDLSPGGGYWHGNEHNLHAPYLFLEAGHPELTQKWVRWILTDRYANTPDGLGGNDDAGALSSWLVFSSVGLYPQAGTELYWVGAPVVERAEWQLAGDARLRILAHGQSAQNMYVAKVLLNGRRLCRPVLRHADLKDARLEFFMTDQPARGGGFYCP